MASPPPVADTMPPRGVPVATPARLDAAALRSLFERLAAHGGTETRFVERRISSLLNEAAESRGVLRYVPPDRFEKRTESPEVQGLVIAGETATVEPANGTRRTLRVDQHPALATLASSLRALLGGDLDALHRAFVVAASGDASRWRIDLVPRDEEARALVTRIDARGQDDTLRRFDLHEAGGDVVELWLIGAGPGPGAK